MMVGTRVMVKAWPTIEGTLNDSGLIWEECGTHIIYPRLNFTKEMKGYCHKKTRLSQVCKNNDDVTVYALEGCDEWWWHEDWFYDMTYKVLPEELFIL